MFKWTNFKRYICLAMIIMVATVTISLLTMCNNDKITKYTINAKFDPTSKTVTANMNIRYYNNGSESLENVLILLYANAFASYDTAPFAEKELSSAYPNGYCAGCITVENVKVNGKDATPSFSSTQQQMTIPLSSKLKKEAYVDISFDFTLIIPNASGRFGYIGDTFNLGNWYPQVAVFNDSQWIYTDYTKVGDPFVSKVADYELNIITPPQYTVIGSSPLACTANENEKAWVAKADSLRDYALVISSELKVISDSIDETVINCYYKDDESQARSALTAAIDAIDLFNDLYGSYPFEQFNIVQTSFYIGGMEYPGIVFIDNEYFNKGNLHPLENVVVHECAHQWWYASVGNDQIHEAWIDEGLATYSTMLYYEKYKDIQTYKLYYKYYVSNAYRFHRDSLTEKYGNIDESFSRALNEYPDSELYSMICYEKSAMMFQCIRELLKDQIFFEALKDLYETGKDGIINADDVKKSFGNKSDKPVEKFIDAWLNDKVHMK